MIDTIVLDFRFSSPLRNGSTKCIAVLHENQRNLGFLPLIYFRGHFRGSPIAKLLLKSEPHHVVKFRKCLLSDVEKSAVGKKKHPRIVMVFAVASARAGDRNNEHQRCETNAKAQMC